MIPKYLPFTLELLLFVPPFEGIGVDDIVNAKRGLWLITKGSFALLYGPKLILIERLIQMP